MTTKINYSQLNTVNEPSDELVLAFNESTNSLIWVVATDSAEVLNLNQTVPQTVYSGAPIFNMGLQSNRQLNIYGTANEIQEITRAASGQSVDMQQYQLSTGAVVGSVGSDGRLSIFGDGVSGVHFLLGADVAASSRTNSTVKWAKFAIPHYSTSEENLAIFYAASTATENLLYFGGGDGGMNSATSIRFLTGANYNTVTGTERMRISSTGNVSIGYGADGATRFHLAGTNATHYAQIDTGINFPQVSRPATAGFFATVLEEVGNVNAGVHYYVYTFVTEIGETSVSSIPAGPYTFDAAHGKATLTVPVSTDYRVSKRKIYRSAAGASQYQLYYCGEIADNTGTSFTDNVADSSLGTVWAWYKPNTTNNMLMLNTVPILFADDYLTAVGYGAGYTVKGAGGSYNTLIGAQAGYDITTGIQNTCVGSAAGRFLKTTSGNVIVGDFTGYLYDAAQGAIFGTYACNGFGGKITGHYNTAIGSYAAYNMITTSNANTILGCQAGYNIGTGASNVFLGFQAGYSETGSNKLYIANTSTATPLIYGIFVGATAGLTVHSQHASGIPLTVKGFTAQSANLQNWVSVSNAIVASITVSGGALFSDKVVFTQTDGNEYIDSLNDGYLDLDATVAVRIGTDATISGMVRQGTTWHAYGGFQNANSTITISGVDTWAHISNETLNLWSGIEASGLTLANDVMTFINGGDYIGSVSLTFSARDGKDFEIRLYNLTQATQMGYVIGATTTGVNNFTNIVLPLYIEANAGDGMRMEIQCKTDGTDPIVRSAVFYLAYLHD